MERGGRRFLYALARELKMTVAVLLQNATAREIGEWAAYFALEQREQDERSGTRPRKAAPKEASRALRGWFGHKVVKGKGK